jgi:class 3 adenylate cyclase
MEKELNVGTQSLLGYLPALLIKNILEEKLNMNDKLPLNTTINTVSLFADISGFTKLSESFSKKGRIGPEFLAFSLNRYMEKLSKFV